MDILNTLYIHLKENGGKVSITNYIKKERVYIEVCDTGRGIPKEEREKVFDSFYTVNKNRSKEHGGTGLGLAIVKELVEKQRGTISIKDTKIKDTLLNLETAYIILQRIALKER